MLRQRNRKSFMSALPACLHQHRKLQAAHTWVVFILHTTVDQSNRQQRTSNHRVIAAVQVPAGQHGTAQHNRLRCCKTHLQAQSGWPALQQYVLQSPVGERPTNGCIT